MARIAKAWGPVSGGGGRGGPVLASGPAGVGGGGGRGGGGPAGRARSVREGAARRSPSAASDQAVQAVGAVQGSSPPCHFCDGKRPNWLWRWATSRSRVRRTDGKSVGFGKGRTAQPAAEASPDMGSAATRTSPKSVTKASQAPPALPVRLIRV